MRIIIIFVPALKGEWNSKAFVSQKKSWDPVNFPLNQPNEKLQAVPIVEVSSKLFVTPITIGFTVDISILLVGFINQMLGGTNLWLYASFFAKDTVREAVIVLVT